MELLDWPRMAFVYLLAVLSSFLKPRWTPIRTFPILEVRLNRAMAAEPKRVSAWRTLVGWGKEKKPSAATATPLTPQAADAATPLPALFFMTQSFRLVMSLLTLPAFPTAIMGTVVNKRARYALLKPVLPAEPVTYTARLDPATRETISGHCELDIHVEARTVGTSSAGSGSGDLVFAAVLTMVLMNPKPRKRDPNAAPPPKTTVADPPSDAPALASWRFATDVGRRYAFIDGDISPMHLTALTAKLNGFPAPVANVHFLAARCERELAAAVDALGGASNGDPHAQAIASSATLLQPLPAPYALELEFKKPTLLPNQLTMTASTAAGVRAGKAGILSLAASDADGFGFSVADKKGRPLAVGLLRSGAKAVEGAMQRW
jgi:acyl dehydratase